MLFMFRYNTVQFLGDSICRAGPSLRDWQSTREPVESSVSLSSLPELHCRNSAASTDSGISAIHVLSASSRGFCEDVPVWCGSKSFPSTNSAVCMSCVWAGLGPFATSPAYSRALQARTKASVVLRFFLHARYSRTASLSFAAHPPEAQEGEDGACEAPRW